MKKIKGGFGNAPKKKRTTEIEKLQDKIVNLELMINDIYSSILPEGFWYNREDGVWYLIMKIIKFDSNYLEIKCDLGEKLVKQKDCIVYKHPYHTIKMIEKGDGK